MTQRSVEKLIEGLTMVMEGFGELQEYVEDEYEEDNDDDLDDDNESMSEEIDASIVTEVRAALESLVDVEDYSPEELASMITAMSDALEEIDPDVFADSGDDLEDNTVDVDDDGDGIDDDYEDYDDDDYDDDDLDDYDDDLD